jgi:hypothetical protein
VNPEDTRSARRNASTYVQDTTTHKDEDKRPCLELDSNPGSQSASGQERGFKQCEYGEEEYNWWSDSLSASQETFVFLWNSNVHYRVHKSPPLNLILGNMIPVHILTYSYSILILPFHLCLNLPIGSSLHPFLKIIMHAFPMSRLYIIFTSHLDLILIFKNQYECRQAASALRYWPQITLSSHFTLKTSFLILKRPLPLEHNSQGQSSATAFTSEETVNKIPKVQCVTHSLHTHFSNVPNI